MRHKGQKIITDKDIEMTGEGFQGEELSGVLSGHEDRLDMLESNLKWIYKNGAVGTGGGGGGGGSTTSWKVVVSRGDTGQTIVNGSTINFSGPGNYTIKVQVYGGGTSTFRVTYSWVNSRGAQTKNVVISRDESFLSQESLLLDTNGSFSIVILNQDTQEPITYNVDYVVTSYVFNLYYVYADDKTRYTPSNNTIFMADVKTKGLMAALDYSVSVGITTSSYSFTDWDGNTISSLDLGEDYQIKEKTASIIYLPLCEDIIAFLSNNENAKYKQFSLRINLLLEGNTKAEDIEPMYLRDNLIPADMYLKVTTSGGGLFDSSQLTPGVDPSTGQPIIINNYPEESRFALGTAAFQLTPYYNSLKPSRTYVLQVFLDDVQLGNLDVTTLRDQSTQAVSIPLTSSGEHRLRFRITAEGVSYSVEYYLFVKESTSSFTWYPLQRVSPEYTSYYRRYFGVEAVSGISQEDTVSMTVNSDRKTYTFTSGAASSYNDYDQLLCVGLQFTTINDIESPICSFNIGNTYEQAIFIYQDKVVISSASSITDFKKIQGTSREIFFPMVDKLDDTNPTNYHLISIYKRLEYREGGNYWKGIYIFIDGILEGVFREFTTVHDRYSGITFYPNNYYSNLFESTCFRHVSGSDELTYLTDHDLLGYYYTYYEKLLGGNISDKEIALYDAFGSFRIGSDNYVYTNDTTIRNIALNSDVPVLMMTYTDNEGRINPTIGGWNQDNFKIWMEKSYPENANIEILPVTVEWSPGGQDIRVITKQGQANAAQFKITPQGSSTLGYRCKNWELYAPDASDNTKKCLYSPNFNPTDTTTFLPEESFTLKADVVDSSHTNNNAIASFVNDISTPFLRSRQEGMYKDYIKNCLSGFPVLVFLHSRYKTAAESESADNENFYFLGIYNFNLGRKSYYNLGYSDNNNLKYLQLSQGFNIYEISETDNTLLNGVEVAEVQGNNKYFDFSQYDPTILFQRNEGDITYMFGDAVTISEDRWTRNLEKLVEQTSKAGGYTFNQVGKKFSTTIDDNYGYNDGYSAIDGSGIPKNQVPNYKFQAKRINEGGITKYEFTEKEAGSESDLTDLILGDTSEEVQEFTPTLDYTSLCEYYTICMAFGLVDSVQKNLNIKTWNADEEYPLWYLAFYDMDTCLGVSNSGSRISYFAFSDYWTSSLDENNRLGETIIYRDYSPVESGASEDSGSSYYDTPSSYIFAVAKYAYSVLPEALRKDLIRHPSNLWGAWRNGTRVTNPTTAIDKQKGCLSSSNYFLETYYTHHLKNVPQAAFNFNYRYKYLVISPEAQNQFDNTNFPKFYGKKVAYTKDWLDGRFHILDAYFNINSVNDVMNVIGDTQILAPSTSSEYKDSSNTDIYVLKDIFSSNAQGNQYANLNYDVTIKARPYSPLIAVGTNATHRYIFPSVANDCIVNLSSSGNQYVLFGGSSLWTELSTVNPFITSTAALNIDSSYFTNLSGNGGTCRTWSIKTPALRTISLTNNANYTGELRFESTDTSSNFPNLQTINISGTALELIIAKASPTTIIANNMRGGKLNIINVPTLTNVSVSGTLDSITVPAWKKNITFPTTSGSTLNCREISVTNDISKYPGSTLNISNNSVLETVTVAGFETVIISGCPKLNTININDSGVLKTLNVVIPQSTSTDAPKMFTIGSETGVVNLSNQSALESIKLQRALMTKIIMPDKSVNLYSEAFRYCENLKYFDGNGTYNITGTLTFADCTDFTLRQSNGAWSNIKVPSSLNDISYTFYIGNTNIRGSIDLSAAQQFLSVCCAGANNVLNASYLFYNQSIEYSKERFISEYNNQTCSLNLRQLRNCRNYTMTFYNCPIDAYNRFMFQGCTPSYINLSYMIGEYTAKNPSATAIRGWEIVDSGKQHVIYATTDFLYEIVSILSSISLFDYNQDSLHLCFLNPETRGILDKVEVSNVFNPFGIVDDGAQKFPSVLRSISGFEFYTQHEFDFSDTFTSSWTTARENGLNISTFMWYDSYSYITDGTLDRLFFYVPLGSVSLFLRNTPGYTSRVDMSEFIDWEQIGKCTNLFYNGSDYQSLGFPKKIDADKFLEVWDNILRKMRSSNSSTSYGIGYIFKNCYVYGWRNDEFFLTEDSSLVNTTIRYTGHLFDGCRFLDNETTSIKQERFVSITHDFLKPLPNLVTAFYDFANMAWEHTIPFDFFQKRKKNTQTVYIQPAGTTTADQRKTATLTYYTYTKDMSSISACFYNIKLHYGEGFDPNAEYNKNSFVMATVIGNEDGISYSSYYTSKTATKATQLEQGTEISDCREVQSYNIQTVRPSGWSRELTNYQNVDGSGRLFVAPDVLYGFQENTTVYITSLFGSSLGDNATVFTGVIPEHFLKQVKTSNISGMFSNLNITPRKLGEITVQETIAGELQSVTHEYYYYIPSNFTNYTNLAGTFNFHLIIPEVHRIHFYLFLNDSLPAGVTSLNNSLPDTSKSSLIGQDSGYYSSWNVDRDINYGIMATPEMNGSTLVSVEDGINMSNFKSLKLDNLIGYGLATFLRGKLFTGSSDPGVSWSSATYLANPSSNYVISVGYSDYGGLSYSFQLSLPLSNQHFLRNTGSGNGCSIHSNSVLNFSSQSITVWGQRYSGVTFIE